MSERRMIQLIGIAFGTALTILAAEFVPLFMAVTTAQAWFLSALLGLAVAWSAVEFLPPLLGDENAAVELPSLSNLLPVPRSTESPEPQQPPGPVVPQRPVRRGSDAVALYSEKVREAVITAWQRTMRKHGAKATLRITDFVAGPLTVSLGAQLPRADRAVIDDASKQIPLQLQSLLGVAGQTQQKGRGKKQNLPIAVAYAGGMLWIDLPSPRPWTPDGALLAARSPQAISLNQRIHSDRTDLVPCIAINSMREPVPLDMANNPTVLWVGPTRRGKTSGLTSALYAICKHNGPERFRFIVATKKISDWRVWMDVPHCVGVYADASQATQMLTGIADAELVARSGDVWGNYPSLLVIADDLKNLIAQDKHIAVPLKEITSAGGECRIYLWASTQGAGSNEDSAGLDNNATFRVVYKPTSDISAYQAAGLSGLNVTGLSEQKGDVFVVDNGRIARAATGLTAPEMVTNLYDDVVGEEGPLWSVAGITLPPVQLVYSTERGLSGGLIEPPVNHPFEPGGLTPEAALKQVPEAVNKRALTDDECLAIYQAHTLGVSERALCKRLYDNYGGYYKEKLQTAMAQAKQTLEGNDIFGQLSDLWEEGNDV